MPILYDTIKREVALKLAQLEGTGQVSLETAYTGSWATALDGAELPISSIKNTILAIEKVMAEAIGDNPSHPARSLLYGQSVALSDGDQIPNTDQTSAEWVGVFDGCFDADSNRALTLMPVQTIADINNNTFFDDTDFYYYNLFGNNIYCTRPEVVLQGCAWDLDTQETAYDAASGESPLPQYLANGWISGVIASAPQVGWVDNSAAFQTHMSIYQQALASIASPGTALPLTAAANPASG